MENSMPVITVVTVACAVVAIALFLAGYIKGFTASINDFDEQSDATTADTSSSFIWLICLAVIGAAVVIALLGVNPVFIMLAPFLSIASAAIIGMLFYIEPRLDRASMKKGGRT
jgi:DMSO reductase anchor subunit